VSKEWIDDTRTPAKNSYQLYSNQFWMPYPAFTRGLPKDTYYAAGFGGQYILIIPSKDMIVVRLGETYVEDDKVLENISEIINYFDDRI
jgi:CubicO group peptidase (beta-lactamase class C family)